MPSLTFFGGISEIGGNKILIKDKDAKIMLDFGQAFGSLEKYYVNYLNPRGVNGIGDFLEFNLLPRIKGLYSEDLLQFTDLKYQKPEIDAVFISHPHIDHIGYIQFIDKEIPIHLGETGKTIIDAIETTSPMAKYGEHNYQTFRTGKKIKVHNLEIIPIHVDHSVPSAYGFIIHTSEGTIAYTGDLRTHGRKSEMTHEFIENARKEKPIVLICEGTRVGSERQNFTEEEVKIESSKILKKEKLAITTFYPRDIDRLNTFYSVAKENNREFVVSTKTAYLLEMLKDDINLKVPNVFKDTNIKVYMRRKKSGEYSEKDYFNWEKPFLPISVNYEYIRKNQSKILLSLDLQFFTELIDIQPKEGEFIRSMSEPFEEDDIDFGVMKKWLEHFNLNLNQLHASGHCSPIELKKLICEISPKKLIPIHTEHAEMVKELVKDEIKEVVLAEKEREMRL